MLLNSVRMPNLFLNILRSDLRTTVPAAEVRHIKTIILHFRKKNQSKHVKSAAYLNSGCNPPKLATDVLYGVFVKVKSISHMRRKPWMARLNVFY
jgi:hypothetical protein